MKRRTFLRRAGIGVGAIITGTVIPTREWLHGALLALGGPSSVKGGRSLPPFSPFELDEGAGVRFLVIGDWGTGGKAQKELATKMVATSRLQGCDYVISTGDNIYPKGVASVEDGQWKRKFVDVYHAQGLTQPFLPTLGNHDYGLEPDAQIAYSQVNPQWQFPSRYYSRSLKGADGTTVELFSLDTQLVQTGVEGAAEEQRLWLDGALGRSKAEWKIVFGHHMLYSNGIYGNLPRLRSAFEETLVRHRVPLYLCGHDHDLQMLKPVRGVSYVVSGGGGGHRNTSWKENTRYAATNMGYVWMAAVANRLHLQFHDASGVAQWGTTLEKG